MKQADVIIIGSGVAALRLANELRDDMNVIILTKSRITDGNSYLAQGGVAAAIGEKDHPYKHFIDTLEAGRFHNDSDAVFTLTKEAPSLLQQLQREGCPFDTNEQGELLLGMEGAHSEKRIVHGGGDATGKIVSDHLTSTLKNNIEVIEHMYVYDLIIDLELGRCVGVKAKNEVGDNKHFFAYHIVLATGGCGQLYSYTSNAKTVTGDGIALAYKAGAEIADMEFIQFHPTLLYIDGTTRGLVSEAVRGEGGRLVTADGEAIMDGVHPLGDLAPRHIVAQTMYDDIRAGKQIFIDLSAVEHFAERFPTITALCETSGVDWRSGYIPVVPGSHFLMGGVKTDLMGHSNIEGLYAIGEVACTGIHGANRLASNSLLEGLFVGKNLAKWLNGEPVMNDGWIYGNRNEILLRKQLQADSNEPINRTHVDDRLVREPLPDIEDIQRGMMDHVGIVRTEAVLMKHKQWLESCHLDYLLDHSFDDFSLADVTRAFMVITASLITNAALQRTESRGGHFRADFPCENNHLWLKKQTIQCRKQKKDENDECIEATATT